MRRNDDQLTSTRRHVASRSGTDAHGPREFRFHGGGVACDPPDHNESGTNFDDDTSTRRHAAPRSGTDAHGHRELQYHGCRVLCDPPDHNGLETSFDDDPSALHHAASRSGTNAHSLPDTGHRWGKVTGDDWYLGPKVLEQVKTSLVAHCQRDHDITDAELRRRFLRHNIVVDPSEAETSNPNMSLVLALTELMRRDNMTIEELTRLVRGETISDPRPNKEISYTTLYEVYGGYVHQGLLLDMCLHGFKPIFKDGYAMSRSQARSNGNHKSANDHPKAVCQYLHDGQRDGALLVLDDSLLERWQSDPRSRVFVSPLGVVAKKGVDITTKGRVITDLSFPCGDSINDVTDQRYIPTVVWGRVATVGKRIIELAVKSGWSPLRPEASKIFASSADVNSAFRNMSCEAASVQAFAVQVSQLHSIVFDLSAAFGWTGSPAFYAVAGNGISFLVGNESPHTMNPMHSIDKDPFFAFEYVDDHISVELDVDDRLEAASCALQLAMMATLGPHCINTKKCVPWTQQLHALGLDWDLQSCTVSMPRDKVDKARSRVQAILEGPTVTKLQLQELLGSLRHVCTCNPSARAFYQRMQRVCNATSGRHPVATCTELIADAQVFVRILQHGRLQGIPLEIFANVQEPDLHLYMDASGDGLAVLDPSSRRYIHVKFDQYEVEKILRFKLLSHFKALSRRQGGAKHEVHDAFTINVREFLSVVWAIGTWGVDWAHAERPIHVRMWLDNTAAIKWTNSLNSPNKLGQQLCRTLAVLLAQFSKLGIHGTRLDMAVIYQVVVSMPSPSGAAQGVRHLQRCRDALAPATRRKYSADWDQWTNWCDRAGAPHRVSTSGAARSDQLYEYALWLHGPPHSNRAATIRGKLCSINWYHKCTFGVRAALHVGHVIALKGLEARERHGPTQLPVTAELLWALRATLDRHDPQDRSIWGTAILGFFFFLRCSEYAITPANSNHHIRCRDVTFQGIDGKPPQRLEEVKTVSIWFRSSKSDQAGVGTSRSLYKSGSEWLCPVGAAWHLAKINQRMDMDRDQAFCSYMDNNGIARQVSSKAMSKALKRAATSLGLDPIQFASHSLRRGGATAMFLGGAKELTVQLFGRWRSDAYKVYTCIDTRQLSHLSSRMISAAEIRHTTDGSRWAV